METVKAWHTGVVLDHVAYTFDASGMVERYTIDSDQWDLLDVRLLGRFAPRYITATVFAE
jgi:hypothetical protein